MTNTLNAQKRTELASIYMVQDYYNQEEVQRLLIQDQLTTAMIGDVLPEHPHPARAVSVLDRGCGPGGWLQQMAQAYPSMEMLVGIDISRSMIQVAREHAETGRSGPSSGVPHDGCLAPIQPSHMLTRFSLHLPTVDNILK